MRTPWRRHQLAWLDEPGWQEARSSVVGDEGLLDALAHWRAAALPWVVTRQSRGAGFAADDPEAGDGAAGVRHGVALGLPLPGRWAHRRVSAFVRESTVAAIGRFPTARAVTPLVVAPRRAAWHWLCATLDALDADTRVHGSHGWQALTGLDHVTPRSDLDLHVEVDGAALADEVAAVLATATGLAVDEPAGRPWLDGELVFPDGAAVAWREWRAARQAAGGAARQVLVKRLASVGLEDVASVAERSGGIGGLPGLVTGPSGPTGVDVRP